ncbi:MAG: HutD family protein [Candidatus Sphingomonas phytovorans]|nr:HutD family protein [Sphingomonas sp.]WEK00870.1 MAG: HutD family protein [Sphingomonas sp.]
MSIRRVLPAVTRRPTPWKNGGGTTTELAVFPADAGMNDFIWRVSIAEVRTAGPFSDFHGVDRILSVLEGELALVVADAPERRLTSADAPLPFPADIPVTGTPIDDDVRDLNVMIRRNMCRAEVERLPGGTVHVDGKGETCLMIVATGDAAVAHGASVETLRPFDALLFEVPIPESIAVKSAESSFAIRLRLYQDGKTSEE